MDTAFAADHTVAHWSAKVLFFEYFTAPRAGRVYSADLIDSPVRQVYRLALQGLTEKAILPNGKAPSNFAGVACVPDLVLKSKPPRRRSRCSINSR